MKSHVMVSTGTAVQMLGLGLIAGGMLAIGAFVAPTMFGAFPREEAGATLLVVFRRFDTLLLVSLGMVLSGELLRLLSLVFPVKHPLSLGRYLLIAGLTGSLLYATLNVNAEIEALHRVGGRPDASAQGMRFMELHKLSESIYKLDIFAAVFLILLTPFVPAQGGRRD